MLNHICMALVAFVSWLVLGLIYAVFLSSNVYLKRVKKYGADRAFNAICVVYNNIIENGDCSLWTDLINLLLWPIMYTRNSTWLCTELDKTIREKNA